MKPTVSAAAKPRKQYYFSDGTPVHGTFPTVERQYVNKDGVIVYEKPNTAKDMENLWRIIAEVKAENFKKREMLNSK